MNFITIKRRQLFNYDKEKTKNLTEFNYDREKRMNFITIKTMTINFRNAQSLAFYYRECKK